MKHNKPDNTNPHNFGLTVEVQNGNVDLALRKLKKKVSNDGRIQEVREREEFVSETTKRVKAKKSAQARNRKRLASELTTRKRLY